MAPNLKWNNKTIFPSQDLCKYVQNGLVQQCPVLSQCWCLEVVATAWANRSCSPSWEKAGRRCLSTGQEGSASE